MTKPLGPVATPLKKGAAGSGVAAAMGILEMLAASRQTLSLGELAQRLRISKTTVARAVAALEAAGYVVRHPSGRTYGADYGVLALAGDLLHRLALRQRAAPHLHRLAARTGCPCYLGALWRGEAVVLDRATPVLVHDQGTDIGKHNPLHISSMARAILAYLPAAQREAALALCDFAPLFAGTITDVAVFRGELDRTRDRGYARVEGEQGPGRRSVAAPVFDAAGAPVGAVATANWDPELTAPARLRQLIEDTRETALAVSHALGFAGADPGANLSAPSGAGGKAGAARTPTTS